MVNRSPTQFKDSFLTQIRLNGFGLLRKSDLNKERKSLFVVPHYFSQFLNHETPSSGQGSGGEGRIGFNGKTWVQRSRDVTCYY